MAMALTAWLIAPAPMAWTSTFCWVRMTPAMAPATATGFEVAETLRTSTGAGTPFGETMQERLGRLCLGSVALAPRADYLAYSTERVSRSTVTRTWPG